MNGNEHIELLGLYEAAETLKISTSALFSIKKRDPEYKRLPRPIADLKGTPVWLAKDIRQYGVQSGRITEVSFPSVEISGNSKTIAVVGRAKTGKSFLIGMFLKDSTLYRKMFCGIGDDKTLCNMKIILTLPITLTTVADDYVPSLEFKSNFHTIIEDIIKRNPNIDSEETRNLKADSEILNGIKIIYSSNSDTLSQSISRVENLIKEINDLISNKDIDDSNIFFEIEIHSRPSCFAESIMRELKINRMEIFDTPGVSGKIKCRGIQKADLYVFLLRPENKDEATTLHKIVDDIKPHVATAPACFLYRTQESIDSEEDFKNQQEEASTGIKFFEMLFDDLKDSIISTDMAVLQPSKFCLCFPPMKRDSDTTAEQLFKVHFKSKLLRHLDGQQEHDLNKLFNEAIVSNKGDALRFIEAILADIPYHKRAEEGDYFSTFINAKHDRVGSNDRWRLYNVAFDAYKTEKELLFNYFNDIKAASNAEEWKQYIIRYLYHSLSSGTKQDMGLGIGTHPFEMKPALTMLITESILARALFTEIQANPEGFDRLKYIDVLRNNGIRSSSWDCVVIRKDENAIKKLEIINLFLLEIPSKNLYDLVLFRYIGGLRKFKEYEILKPYFENESELMNFVAKFRF